MDAKDAFIKTYIGDLPDDEHDSVSQLLDVFAEALQVFALRNRNRRDLWKKSDWRMNLMHACDKAGRLWHALWNDKIDTHMDDAVDLLNYVAFFMITYRKAQR